MTGNVSELHDRDATAGMGAFGYFVAAGIAVLTFPLWPFVAVAYLLAKAIDGDREESTIDDADWT